MNSDMFFSFQLRMIFKTSSSQTALWLSRQSEGSWGSLPSPSNRRDTTAKTAFSSTLTAMERLTIYPWAPLSQVSVIYNCLCCCCCCCHCLVLYFCFFFLFCLRQFVNSSVPWAKNEDERFLFLFLFLEH